MQNKVMGLLYSILWVAFFVCLGFMLLIAIPLGTPGQDETKTVVKSFIENGKDVILGFFGVLGGIIGILKTWDAFRISEEEEEEVEQDMQSNDSTLLRSKLNQAISVAKRRLAAKQAVEADAIRFYSYVVVIWTSVSVAVCFLASAGIQGLVHTSFPPKNYMVAGEPNWLFFPIAFAQTELLILGAVLIPSYYYRKFLSRTWRYPARFGEGNANRIGGVSFLLVGLISLLTLTPEQISTMLTNADIREMPGLDDLGIRINYFLYLVIFRLVLFPLLGLITCRCIRWSQLRSAPNRVASKS